MSEPSEQENSLLFNVSLRDATDIAWLKPCPARQTLRITTCSGRFAPPEAGSGRI